MTEDFGQQWSYGTRLNNCSDNKSHKENCDGNCGQYQAAKGQVDLHNEIVKWEAAGVPIWGKPAVISQQIPIPGFDVEILVTDKVLDSLIHFLSEKGIIDHDEFMEFHRHRFTNFLKQAREQWQVEKAKASIIVPHIGLGKLPDDGKLH
jgi:hypothetical protein